MRKNYEKKKKHVNEKKNHNLHTLYYIYNVNVGVYQYLLYCKNIKNILQVFNFVCLFYPHSSKFL